MRVVFLFFAVAIPGCDRKPPPVANGESCGLGRERVEVREASRTLFRRECGECHIGGTETARPKALEIFDLAEAEWASKMTEAQLANAAWRLGEPFNEREGPRSVSQSERDTFERYRQLELTRRAGACSRDHR